MRPPVGPCFVPGPTQERGWHGQILSKPTVQKQNNSEQWELQWGVSRCVLERRGEREQFCEARALAQVPQECPALQLS